MCVAKSNFEGILTKYVLGSVFGTYAGWKAIVGHCDIYYAKIY